MRWEYERDGLIVLVGVVLVAAVVELAGPGSFVTTFVAAFLGTLAAFGLRGVMGGAATTPGGDRTATRRDGGSVADATARRPAEKSERNGRAGPEPERVRETAAPERFGLNRLILR